MTRLLIEKGADVNTKTATSWTPLHVACESGAEATVKLLLESGAGPSASIKNVMGDTPADLARKFKHPELLKILP
jgi:ankyrin repeat protein